MVLLFGDDAGGPDGLVLRRISRVARVVREGPLRPRVLPGGQAVKVPRGRATEVTAPVQLPLRRAS